MNSKERNQGFMGEKISRRNFLKATGVSVAATAVLTGCGTASRYVERRTYEEMPEYTLPGTSTYYATTCGECPAGCGTIVRTSEGRALKVDGNPNHPVNRGRTCSRGQTAVQGLYNPDRYQEPVRQANRGSGNFEPIDWEGAVAEIAQVFQSHQPDEIAFLMGMAPDHLFDLVQELTEALGVSPPLRYDGLTLFEARRTLEKASNELFASESLPYFDIGNGDVVFSFGANFMETWLSPVAFSGAFGQMRQGNPGKRGYLVQFEPRMSQTGASADEWIPVTPGSEGLVALGLGKLIAEFRGVPEPLLYGDMDIQQAVDASGIPLESLERLARVFADSDRPLAIPGHQAMSHENGLAAAEVILVLNSLVDNLGDQGGVFLPPEAQIASGSQGQASTFEEIKDLTEKIRDGKIKTLFIHNANPVFELPMLGFEELLSEVEQVFSFASFQDETSQLADIILPDHTALESWGYQKSRAGTANSVLSSFQPVVAPFYDTRATADVLLSAVQSVGGTLAEAAPYNDEVAYLQHVVQELNGKGGYFTAPEEHTFWSLWLQSGGWWQAEPGLQQPVLDKNFWQKVINFEPPEIGDLAALGMVVYPSPLLGAGSGANRSWLQETPDPTTTVMWNSWVEINPDTAHELGLDNGDVVQVKSEMGEVKAAVYLYPAIRPDVIAIPVGQGHTVFGQFAMERGCNPLRLLDKKVNAAGDLVSGALKVSLKMTGELHELARKESIPGVYENDH
jgi:anaerobic selenocysteine-containing dehydrogenase